MGRILKEVFLIVLGFFLVFTPGISMAQAGSASARLMQTGSVNMQANVRERKPTDTTNDFDLSVLGASTATVQGRVLGAQSERQLGLNVDNSLVGQVAFLILLSQEIIWFPYPLLFH